MRAVSYIRVSTEEQLEGHSLDAQRTSTRAFIAERGWTFVGEYLDAGISAKSDSYRPALERLLQDARQRRFDVVVVDKVDRFYRYLKGLLITLDVLNENGVAFVSVHERLDLSTPWGKLTLTVLGMLAEIYIDNLREETRKGKLARARKGLWNGSIPLGYCNGRCSACTDLNGPGYCPDVGGPDRSDDKLLVVHPVEGEAVRRAFRWYLTGQFSDGAIAERLNADGLELPNGRRIPFRSKGRPGRFPPGPFSKESVRDLLQRRFYTGVVVYYGVDEQGRKRKRGNAAACFPGQHPALISEEEFERAQVLRRQFSRRSRRGNSQPNIYPLSGLLICDTCGKRMRAVSSKRRRYYRDVTRIEHSGVCDQPTLRAEQIEEQVVSFLSSLRLPSDWRNRIVNEMIPPEEQAALEERERKIQTRLERASELYLEGVISRERFLEEKWQYQVSMANLRPAEMSAIIEAGEILENFEHRWEKAVTPLEKNGLLRLALAGVRIKGHTLTAVQPTLPFYPLMLNCLSGSDGNSPTFQ